MIAAGDTFVNSCKSLENEQAFEIRSAKKQASRAVQEGWGAAPFPAAIT